MAQQFGSFSPIDRWKKSERLASRAGDRGPFSTLGSWAWTRGLGKGFGKAGTFYGPEGQYGLSAYSKDSSGVDKMDTGQMSSFYNPYEAGDESAKLAKNQGIGRLGGLEERGIGGGLGLGEFQTEGLYDYAGRTGSREGYWYDPWTKVLKNKGFSEEQIERIKAGERVDAGEDSWHGGLFSETESIDELYEQYGDASLTVGDERHEYLGGGAAADVTRLHQKYGEAGLDVTDPDSIAYHTAFKKYKDNLGTGKTASIVDFSESPEFKAYQDESSKMRQSLKGAEFTPDEIKRTGAGFYLPEAERAILPQLMETSQEAANISSGGLAWNPFAQRKRQDLLSNLSEYVSGKRGVMHTKGEDYLSNLIDDFRQQTGS